MGFTDSALWCVNLFHCFDVSVDGIRVFGQWRYNTDGVDIVNSQRVCVKNCFVHSFDDSITVKGIDAYAQTDNTDILVENCVLWCDWGKTLELGHETACEAYARITFRNCDILRGGNTACDIQNGDCANIRDVLYEDIRVELESFYTPHKVQESDAEYYTYDAPYEVAAAVNFTNLPRFREAYGHLGLPPIAAGSRVDAPTYAAIHQVTARNIQVYCDEKILAERGVGAAWVRVTNGVQGSEYAGIVIENISVNGMRISPDRLNIKVRGEVRDIVVL